MAKYKDDISKSLQGVRNTTNMVKKFCLFLKKFEVEEIPDVFKDFEELYGKYPYYEDVKESIFEMATIYERCTLINCACGNFASILLMVSRVVMVLFFK